MVEPSPEPRPNVCLRQTLVVPNVDEAHAIRVAELLLLAISFDGSPVRRLSAEVIDGSIVLLTLVLQCEA
jgi:hypothetical protein